MRLSLGVRTGEKITNQLAEDLGLSETGEIDPVHLSVCTDFAHSSDSASEFAEWYLRAECFSKFLSDGDEEARERAALDAFIKAEQECHAINERLVDPWTRASLNQTAWRRARQFVAEVLGPFPWEQFPAACAFGPGASSEMRSREAYHQNKWALSTHITEGALPYHLAFLNWARNSDIPRDMAVVTENKVFTVPKRYDIGRTCAAEPTWNMFYQKGVGKLIRRRLNRFGLLLPDAQEKNRALARLGSWTNSLATLDVRAASEFQTIALMEAVLPETWFRVLMDLRSPEGVLPDGRRVTYGKISSMGNGYTFELETLVFYALTMAISGKGNMDRVSVFGDDIICPSEHAPAVAVLLAEAGFQVNDRKSFIDGPFRESCGGHYWKGVDVSPFYLRHHPAHQLDSIVLGNHLTAWAARFPETGIRRKLKYTAGLVRSTVSKALRGPYGMDGVLWDSWDNCCPYWFRDFQSYRQWVCTQQASRKDFSASVGGLLHGLWVGTEDSEASFGTTPRGVYRMQRVFVDRDAWKPLPVRLA